MIESGPLLLAIGFGGAVAFLSFIWMATVGLRKGSSQRARENEEIRQADLRRARGEE